MKVQVFANACTLMERVCVDAPVDVLLSGATSRGCSLVCVLKLRMKALLYKYSE